VLYEASTGKDRHEFPELPTLLDQLPEQVRFLELNEVSLHACSPQASSRYASAEDMHAELVVLANWKSVKRLRLLEQRLSRLKRISVRVPSVCLPAFAQHPTFDRTWPVWAVNLQPHAFVGGSSTALLVIEYLHP
jgi:hypothetical protein